MPGAGRRYDDRARIENDEALDFPAPIAELSALYPARANAEWESLVAGIMKGAAPELARRREERGFMRLSSR